MKSSLSNRECVRDLKFDQFLFQAADDYLHDRSAIDAALIFQTEMRLDQSLYYLIGNSYIRVIVINQEEPQALDRLAKMRPSPSYYVAHGDTPTLTSLFR